MITKAFDHRGRTSFILLLHLNAAGQQAVRRHRRLLVELVVTLSRPGNTSVHLTERILLLRHPPHHA